MTKTIDEAAQWLAFLLARKEQLRHVEEGSARQEVLDEVIAEMREELKRLALLDHLKGTQDWLNDKEGEIPF